MFSFTVEMEWFWRQTTLRSQLSHFCVIKACSVISLSSALSVKMEIQILACKLRNEVYMATHTMWGG